MRIVKCRFGQREQFEAIPGFVYCGRKFGGFDRSPLANPYRGSHALEHYRDWLRLQIEVGNGEVLAALDALTPDSVLGCWCLDRHHAAMLSEECHCDVIAQEWARRLVTKAGAAK